MLKLESVNRVQLTVPFLLLNGLFFQFYLILLRSIELPLLQVLQTYFIAFSDEFDLLFSLYLFLLFQIFLLLVMHRLFFSFDTCTECMKVYKDACDRLVKVYFV